MFIRWQELTVIASGNKLQLISPSKYNSLFSASLLAITFSYSLNKLGGELGGRYQVPTRNGVDSIVQCVCLSALCVDPRSRAMCLFLKQIGYNIFMSFNVNN